MTTNTISAEGNQTAVRFAHIPRPIGSVRLWQWEVNDTQEWSRAFEHRPRHARGVTVWIEGRQHADGTVQAFLGIDADAGAASGQQIDPAAAREVAVMLCEATDELERCTGIAPPF